MLDALVMEKHVCRGETRKHMKLLGETYINIVTTLQLHSSGVLPSLTML